MAKKARSREELEDEVSVLLAALIRRIAEAIKELDVSKQADVRLPEISGALRVAIDGVKVVPRRAAPKVAATEAAAVESPAGPQRKLSLYRPTEKLRGA